MLQELRSKIISNITKENKEIIYQVKNIILEEVIKKNVSPVLGYTWSGKYNSAENEKNQKEYICNFFKNLFIFEGAEKLIYNLDLPTVLKLKNNYFDISIEVNLITQKEDLCCSYVISHDIEQYHSEVVFSEMEISFLDGNSNTETMLTEITCLDKADMKDFVNIIIYTGNTYSHTYSQNENILDLIIENFELDNKEFIDFLLLSKDFNMEKPSILSHLYNTLTKLKEINNTLEPKITKNNGVVYV